MKHLSTYQIFEKANVTDPIQIIKNLNINKYAKYTLNTDNSIDVEGNINLSHLRLKKMPVKFGKVTGNFYCFNNNLTSLKHCPITVSGNFYCSYNLLTSLEHGPTTVTGNFRCSNNLLTSLEHCPITVSGDFYCYRNQLTSLEHCPITVKRNFDCSNNLLTSLKHGPTNVLGSFDCSNNQLTSLKHCPTTVTGNFRLFCNEFPENIQEKIDNFKGTWQELLFLINIWQSKKLTDLDKKTGLFN
jgi:hypothetical protein